jgi:hypothetical protein
LVLVFVNDFVIGNFCFRFNGIKFHAICLLSFELLKIIDWPISEVSSAAKWRHMCHSTPTLIRIQLTAVGDKNVFKIICKVFQDLITLHVSRARALQALCFIIALIFTVA